MLAANPKSHGEIAALGVPEDIKLVSLEVFSNPSGVAEGNSRIKPDAAPDVSSPQTSDTLDQKGGSTGSFFPRLSQSLPWGKAVRSRRDGHQPQGPLAKETRQQEVQVNTRGLGRQANSHFGPTHVTQQISHDDRNDTLADSNAGEIIPTGKTVALATILPSEPVLLPSSFVCSTSPVCRRCGVRCGGRCDNPLWTARGPIPWKMFAQGEYVGPARLAHLNEYRLRVDDIIQFVYRLDGKPSRKPYELEVGDIVSVESITAVELDRKVTIQPDGKITLRLLGQVAAAGRTLDDLQADVEEQYKEHVQLPNISITPIKMNITAEQLINTVDRRFGAGGQSQQVRVTPAGTVQLPAVASVAAHGLTLDELKFELERRYSRLVYGMEITPILAERAPRFVYVVGEVKNPGRFVLEGPTTVMQAIALAKSWNVGANLGDVVVLRRDENWQLMATKLDLNALFGHRPCPPDEIWLRDFDIVLVPKHPVLRVTDIIDLVFTRGLYGVVPASIRFSKLTTI